MFDHARQHEQRRGTRKERGYGSDWDRLRNWYMAQPSNILCRHCKARWLRVLATDCDHIKPFVGVDDVLRLDSQ